MLDTLKVRDRMPKILIADDDPAFLRLLADRCAKMGFQVDTATNGMRLLIKARQSRPEALIVDVNMPELDGISACVRLLEPGGELANVIAVTGYANQKIAERSKSLGLYYEPKGPDLWRRLQAALTKMFPEMAEEIAKVAAASADAEIPLHPRVLVVDDDPDTKQFFSSRLGKYGLDTLYASDAVHGIRLALKQQPVAIVSNFKIADGTAFYLLQRLRSTPETGNTPVFVVSKHDIDDLTVHTLKREIGGHPGATHVFKKSFDADELFEELQKYCSFVKTDAPQRDLTEKKWREIAVHRPAE